MNRLERGQGIILQNSSITALGSSPNIKIQGTGGEAEDKINSKDNTGIKITSSTINSEDVGGNHVYVGKGGRKA